MIFMGDDFSRTTDEGKLPGYTLDQEEVLDQMNEELTGKQIDLLERDAETDKMTGLYENGLLQPEDL